MAVTSINFTGKSVIVYNSNNEQVARTTIIEYIKEEMQIVILGEVPALKRGESLTLLIILDDGVYEFMGTLGKSLASTTNIALSKGRPKEGRISTRYKINQPAVIESMFIASKKISLPTPIPVFVLNISAAGILFSSPPKFNLGARFEYKMATGDNFVHMPATVVRMKTLDKDTAEYGCKFEKRPELEA